MKVKVLKCIQGNCDNPGTCSRSHMCNENRLIKPCNVVLVNGHSFKLTQYYKNIHLCWMCGCGWEMFTEIENNKLKIMFEKRLENGFLTTQFMPECTYDNKMEMILA